MDDKNNKPLEPIKQVEKEKLREKIDEKKPSTDTSADTKSKEREEQRIKNAREEERILENQRAEEDIKERQSIREERKRYANKTFRSVWIYVGIVIGIVVVDGVIAVCYDKDFLESIPLVTLIGTIPASMALFGWVLKGLFPMDKNK